MPLLRADVESDLDAQSGPIIRIALTAPGPPPVPPDGPTVSAWLNWPIADALGQCGLSPLVRSLVSDLDLSEVSDALVPRFTVLCRLAMKRQLRGSLAMVNLQRGTDKQDLADLAKQLDREIKDLQDFADKHYGLRPMAAIVAPMTSACDPGAGGLEPWRAAGYAPPRYPGEWPVP